MLLLNQQEKPTLTLIKWGLRVLAFLLVATPNATNKLSWEEFKTLRMAATIAGLVAAGGSAISSSALREQEPYKLMRNSAKLDAYDAVITNEVNAIASSENSENYPQQLQPAPLTNDEAGMAAAKIQSALTDAGLSIHYHGSQIGCSAIRLLFKPDKLADAPKVAKQSELIHAACGLASNEKPAISVDRGLIRIDLPRQSRQFPQFSDYVKAESRQSPIKMLLGLDTFTGEPIYHKLSARGTSPNMRIGGTSGGGKSMALNAMIQSLIHWYTPKQIQFVVLDLKGGNYSWLEGSPWMWRGYRPAESVEDAIALLEEVEAERKHRQSTLFKSAKVKDLDGYNSTIQPDEQLPVLLTINDETAAYFASIPKRGREGAIIDYAKVAALGRSAGVFSIVATQKPVIEDNGTPVLPTTIKENHPNGLAFKISTPKGTELILGSNEVSAQSLAGKGDFYFKNEAGVIIRGQTLAVPEDTEALAQLVQMASDRPGCEAPAGEVHSNPQAEIINHLKRSWEAEFNLTPTTPNLSDTERFEQIKGLKCQGVAKTEIICKLWNCSPGGSNFDRRRQNSPLNQYETLIEKFAERWVCELVAGGHSAEAIARLIWGVVLDEVEAKLKDIYDRNFFKWS